MRQENLNYSIYSILRELEDCLKEKKYFAALSIALILPDICSKIMDDKETGGNRYSKWCNVYLVPYLPSIMNIMLFETDWGRIIYQLRCGVLHNGENDAKEYKKYKHFKLEDFNLYVDESKKPLECPLRLRKIDNRIEYQNETYVKIDIDIRYLAYIIEQGTLAFINDLNLNEQDFPVLEINVYGNNN